MPAHTTYIRSLPFLCQTLLVSGLLAITYFYLLLLHLASYLLIYHFIYLLCLSTNYFEFDECFDFACQMI